MDTSQTVGGSGGSNGRFTTRDVRLIERAIRESWDLPEDTRRAMVARLGTMIADPETKTRAFLAAAKTLIALSRVNLSAVDVAIRARSAEDVVERLKDMEAWIASHAAGACDQGPRINPVRRDYVPSVSVSSSREGTAKMKSLISRLEVLELYRRNRQPHRLIVTRRPPIPKTTTNTLIN
jgi:hypothetical protein